MMRRRRFFAALVMGGLLSGCATVNNIDQNYQFDSAGNKGLILFSVTQDKGPPAFLGGKFYGSMVQAFFDIRGEGLGQKSIRAMSLNEPILTTDDGQFEDVLGRVHVRELPPGRYEIFNWTLLFNTGSFTALYHAQNPATATHI